MLRAKVHLRIVDAHSARIARGRSAVGATASICSVCTALESLGPVLRGAKRLARAHRPIRPESPGAGRLKRPESEQLHFAGRHRLLECRLVERLLEPFVEHTADLFPQRGYPRAVRLTGRRGLQRREITGHLGDEVLQ